MALHKVSHECVWLRLMDGFVKGSCGFLNVPKSPTVINKDKAACIAQTKVATSKGTESNTSYQSSFSLMNYWDQI